MTKKNVGLPEKNAGILPSIARQLNPLITAAIIKAAKKTEAISASVCPPRNPVLKLEEAGDDKKGAGYRDRDCHERRDDRGITQDRRSVEQPGMRRLRAKR